MSASGDTAEKGGRLASVASVVTIIGLVVALVALGVQTGWGPFPDTNSQPAKFEGSLGTLERRSEFRRFIAAHVLRVVYLNTALPASTFEASPKNEGPPYRFAVPGEAFLDVEGQTATIVLWGEEPVIGYRFVVRGRRAMSGIRIGNTGARLRGFFAVTELDTTVPISAWQLSPTDDSVLGP